MPKRSRGVTVLAILAALFGLLLIAGGWPSYTSPEFESLEQAPDAASSVLSDLTSVLYDLTGVTGFAYIWVVVPGLIISAVGLFFLRNWARQLTLAISAIGLIHYALLALSAKPTPVVGIVIAVVFHGPYLVFFTRPGVKAQFQVRT